LPSYWWWANGRWKPMWAVCSRN